MTPFAKKLITMSLVLLVISMCVYAGFLYEVSRSGKRLQEWSNKQIEQVSREQQFSALEKLYEESEKDRAVLKNFVVTHEGVANFLALMENAGRNRGLLVNIRSVQISPIKDSPSFETLKVSVEVGGTYEGLVDFLPVIESLPYQIEITSVSLNHIEGTSWKGLFELQVVKEKSL
jgi:Tfp pilus assembly protein PilO